MNRTGKESLRARLTAARRAVPAEERAARSREVARRVAALPAFERARAVALYAPMGAEVDTAELARLAAAAGKRLVWPRMVEGSLRLQFAACAAAELVPGPRATRQPPAGAPAVEPAGIDLLCVPGVAFDAARRRLGRGAGHYDATLAALPRGALRIGLAFDLQVVEEVPAEPHDQPVDLVATETRLLAPAGAAGG